MTIFWRMWRRTLRFAALLGWSAFFLPQALVSRVLGACGARALALRMAAGTQTRWARRMLRVLRVEIEQHGTPPAGTHLVVANHLSYLDILVLAARFPGRFVAKSEIASWPLLGQLAAAVGTIFVVQARRRDVVRVAEEMRRTLAAGVSVLLFPEGHSTRGTGVDRLHSALLESAARGSIPCLAVALSYDTPADPWAPAATVCWWGGMRFWPHAWGLVGLERIEARVSLSDRARTGHDRKELAAQLGSDLAARVVPVRQAPIPPAFRWPEIFQEPERRDGAEPVRGVAPR